MIFFLEGYYGKRYQLDRKTKQKLRCPISTNKSSGKLLLGEVKRIQPTSKPLVNGMFGVRTWYKIAENSKEISWGNVSNLNHQCNSFSVRIRKLSLQWRFNTTKDSVLYSVLRWLLLSSGYNNWRARVDVKTATFFPSPNVVTWSCNQENVNKSIVQPINLYL